MKDIQSSSHHCVGLLCCNISSIGRGSSRLASLAMLTSISCRFQILLGETDDEWGKGSEKDGAGTRFPRWGSIMCKVSLSCPTHPGRKKATRFTWPVEPIFLLAKAVGLLAVAPKWHLLSTRRCWRRAASARKRVGEESVAPSFVAFEEKAEVEYR